MAKTKLKTSARLLRSQGESIKFVARSLGVSTSTASLWCRDVKLSSEQIHELERRSHDPTYGKRLENSTRQRKEKERRIIELRNEGIDQIGLIDDKERFIAGVALYWAEGFKKDNLVGFSNSDPEMVKFFISWLKRCFGYSREHLKLRVGINEGAKNRTKAIEEFWSTQTEVPLSQFQKPFYQKVVWKKHYENPGNYHGVLRIRVAKSTDFLRRITGYIDGLKVNV